MNQNDILRNRRFDTSGLYIPAYERGQSAINYVAEDFGTMSEAIDSNSSDDKSVDNNGDPKKENQKYVFKKRVGKNSEVLSRLEELEIGGNIDRVADKTTFKANTIKWISHGSINGIGGGMTFEEFDKFLYNNSSMYKSAMDNNTPLRLELYACYVGTYNGLAEKISKLRPNLTIQASNYTIVMRSDLKHYIGDPGGKRLGIFNIYKDGEVTNTANFKN